MDFDYKKYSLENLENWMHDAMACGGATPQEIYDVIVDVVKENYYTYKHQTSQAYELLALLNSGVDDNKYQNHLNKVLSCDKDDSSEKCKKSWTSFWEEDYHPEEHQQYTEEELNAMCDKAESDQKHSNHYYEYDRNDPNRQNPFNKEKSKTLTYDEAVAAGWEMTADGIWIKETSEDKVTKWRLPVEVDGPSGEYFVCFPDDLLLAANLKEGDQINWVDNGDGSYTIVKVTKPLGSDEC